MSEKEESKFMVEEKKKNLSKEVFVPLHHIRIDNVVSSLLLK